METFSNPINSYEAFELKMSTPEALLFPGEIAILREMHTSLNRLYSRLSAINEDVQKRAEAIRKQSLNSDYGDSNTRIKEEAIAEYLRMNGTADVIPDEIQLGHEDNPELRGRNPHNPIETILMDLSNARCRIERLIHIEPLQTKAGPESLPTFLRQLDGGSIHGRTDKSIDTNNPL